MESAEVKCAPSYRDAAFMGVMRWAVFGELMEKYGDVSMTYGYITKNAHSAGTRKVICRRRVLHRRKTSV